jgi:dolichyl-phosphate beta-glucosyltransferase
LRLSLIVPAYNEATRITTMLVEYVDYLKKHCPDFEVIVVDDGSKDDTYFPLSVSVALEAGRRLSCNLKVVKCGQNGGKGLAVKIGMLCASGELLLFADADNATAASSMGKLFDKIDSISKKGLGAVIGSRNHQKVDVKREVNHMQRDWFRSLLSYTCNRFIKWMLNTRINVSGRQDTQCGFKLFTRLAAQKLFVPQHLERWAFDLELIFLCST